MERTIYLPAKDNNTTRISADDVDSLFDTEGLIFVYNKNGQLCGSVIYNEYSVIMATMDTTDTFGSVKQLMQDHPEYTYKFVN